MSVKFRFHSLLDLHRVLCEGIFCFVLFWVEYFSRKRSLRVFNTSLKVFMHFNLFD